METFASKMSLLQANINSLESSLSAERHSVASLQSTVSQKQVFIAIIT